MAEEWRPMATPHRSEPWLNPQPPISTSTTTTTNLRESFRDFRLGKQNTSLSSSRTLEIFRDFVLGFFIFVFSRGCGVFLFYGFFVWLFFAGFGGVWLDVFASNLSLVLSIRKCKKSFLSVNLFFSGFVFLLVHVFYETRYEFMCILGSNFFLFCFFFFSFFILFKLIN